eukprot:5639925-Prymnesium_polylepis.1
MRSERFERSPSFVTAARQSSGSFDSANVAASSSRSAAGTSSGVGSSGNVAVGEDGSPPAPSAPPTIPGGAAIVAAAEA